MIESLDKQQIQQQTLSRITTGVLGYKLQGITGMYLWICP